jgi:hypothetical protein
MSTYFITGIDPNGNGFGFTQSNIGVPVAVLLAGYRSQGYTNLNATLVDGQTTDDLTSLVPNPVPPPPSTPTQPTPPPTQTAPPIPQPTEPPRVSLVVDIPSPQAGQTVHFTVSTIPTLPDAMVTLKAYVNGAQVGFNGVEGTQTVSNGMAILSAVPNTGVMTWTAVVNGVESNAVITNTAAKPENTQPTQTEQPTTDPVADEQTLPVPQEPQNAVGSSKLVMVAGVAAVIVIGIIVLSRS